VLLPVVLTQVPPTKTGERPMSKPYRVSPIFDQASLPKALTVEHRTKKGVWGIIRVLEGELTYLVLEGSQFVSSASSTRISPALPGIVLPDEPHRLQADPAQPFRLQVEFYDHDPRL
jgi:hemoglobin